MNQGFGFLRYAQSPEDFEIETAGKVMKIKLPHTVKKKNRHGIFMQAIILEIPGAGGLISIWIKVGQCVYISVMEGDPPATPICQMDLDQFHPLLVQAGFTYTGEGTFG